MIRISDCRSCNGGIISYPATVTEMATVAGYETMKIRCTSKPINRAMISEYMVTFE
ncbi:hypothetical protein JWG39_15615 [Desulforhopalus vacuolatus]|uniref:hypothetical protein n=1 Tax=Desulforhopalus vacuolatus TaxID=40414 RepID=UPI001963DD1F|nr:hypothetical protein [Desulforhopalus vacuolatus]MBM9521248.1 hypothetical protein [Desulforhopalus vacuolatus]